VLTRLLEWKGFRLNESMDDAETTLSGSAFHFVFISWM